MREKHMDGTLQSVVGHMMMSVDRAANFPRAPPC